MYISGRQLKNGDQLKFKGKGVMCTNIMYLMDEPPGPVKSSTKRS